MEDTMPKMTERMAEMISAKTAEERLKMGSSMYQTSKELVTRYILENNPNISKIALKQELFLKFYGDDFNEKEKQKILNFLAKSY